jgi:cytochrome c-type biogenesis protein CcmH
MIRALVFFLLCTVTGIALATIDAYEFNSMEDEQRFRQLVEELRCPKCQNQNISDSNAPLAKDIKDRTFKLINEGKSNREITDYMVERYGDFVTYRPPMRPVTWFLWFGPFVLALLAAGIIFMRKLAQRSPSIIQVTPEQEAKVQELLKQLDQNDNAKQP